MGRPATSRQATHRGAGVVDRSAHGVLCPDQGPAGTAARGPARPGSVLPAPAPAPHGPVPPEGPTAGREVTPRQRWFPLPVPERQRCGHCSSAMLRTALGLRSAPAQAVTV